MQYDGFPESSNFQFPYLQFWIQSWPFPRLEVNQGWQPGFPYYFIQRLLIVMSELGMNGICSSYNEHVNDPYELEKFNSTKGPIKEINEIGYFYRYIWRSVWPVECRIAVLPDQVIFLWFSYQVSFTGWSYSPHAQLIFEFSVVFWIVTLVFFSPDYRLFNP